MRISLILTIVSIASIIAAVAFGFPFWFLFLGFPLFFRGGSNQRSQQRSYQSNRPIENDQQQGFNYRSYTQPTVYCTNCGFSLEPEWQFCPQCSTPRHKIN